MLITCQTFNEKGLKRKTNQDKITSHTSENISLFAVADGMGGHSDGEYAGETVIKYLDTLWEELRCFSGDIQTAADMAFSALEKANSEIFEYARSKKIICGSTASVLLIIGEFYAVINIGDSPVYRASRRKAWHESTEHSFACVAAKGTGISPDEIDKKRGKRLVRSVGIKDRLFPSVKTGRIANKQIFLICSDGVSRYFTDKQVFRLLKRTAAGKIDLIELSDILKKRTYKMGASDNLSAVLIQVCTDEKVKPDSGKIKIIIAAAVIFFILWAAVNIKILF